MTKYDIRATLTGPDLNAITYAAAATSLFPGAPSIVSIDHEPVDATGWRDAGAHAKREFELEWAERGPRITVRRGQRVFVTADDAWSTAADLVTWLGQLPFELASFRSFVEPGEDESWPDDDVRLENGHRLYASAVAFRRHGHDRLVSRRWLEHAYPWKLYRGEPDISLVLFHELGVDYATLCAQAAPARRRMGASNEGGYIWRDHQPEHTIEGLLDRETATLEIVVAGREVDQRELLDACATRLARRDDPESPIRTIRYVFIDEAEARALQRELWLRELECWTFRAGERVQLVGP